MNIFRKPFRVLLAAALFVSLLFSGCAGGVKPVAREPGKVYELTLLHTNDHHGRIQPVGGQGGLAERATFVKSVRAATANVLLVDAGDLNTGTALANMYDGELDIRAYNLLGYDAVTFGNHEFNVNLERIERQMALSEFPWVSSNVKTRDGRFLGGHQYLVKNYDGFRVGIIGITTLRALVLSNARIMPLTFENEIEAARTAVRLLREREKADIVIALTHMGDIKEYDDHLTSLDLAASVSGIDIIVDGHTHTLFPAPQKIGSTWVVSANEWGRYVGQGKLSVVDGRLVRFDWAPVMINSSSETTYPPDAAMAAFLEPYIKRAEASLKEKIGEASGPFIYGDRLTRRGETAIGNMVCDANVWYIRERAGQEIDFAFHNGGNIRAELPAGPITREHILTVLPFDNLLFLVSLEGRELLQLFDFIATIPQGSGGFPQFSAEVRYTLDITRRSISGLSIGGKSIEPDRVYRFSTNDYLLGGGDGYAVLSRARNPYNTSLLLSSVVIEYIACRGGPVSPVVDGRMSVVE